MMLRLWSFSYTTTCPHRCFNGSRIDAHFCPFAGCSADLKDLLQCSIVSPAAETAVHSLVRAESRREITPSYTTAGKPHNSVQLCSDILLWTACMGNWDDWLDQFPFLIGKFITADFHANRLFLPLVYHSFMSFSCTFGYFLLFRYTLGFHSFWKNCSHCLSILLLALPPFGKDSQK